MLSAELADASDEFSVCLRATGTWSGEGATELCPGQMAVLACRQCLQLRASHAPGRSVNGLHTQVASDQTLHFAASMKERIWLDFKEGPTLDPQTITGS